MKFIIALALSFSALQVRAQLMPLDLPPEEHPGSMSYEFQANETILKVNDRDVHVLQPVSDDGEVLKSESVIVFGHGQAATFKTYSEMLTHLARKGATVVFPFYDDGFFDRDWRRMSSDYNELTRLTLEELGYQSVPPSLVYAGHSKGGYIGLMAAGDPTAQIRPDSVVVFAPAGFDKEYIKNIDSNIKVSIIWGEKDIVIRRGLQEKIFSALDVPNKQLIEVISYEDQMAGHNFCQSSGIIFGDNGVTAFHFHGTWKWLLGATDLIGIDGLNYSRYLYGPEALETGVESHTHLRW